MEFFLKSFIFALGDDWTEVNKLATKFKDYLRLINEKDTLNAAQASDFLQKQVRMTVPRQQRTRGKSRAVRARSLHVASRGIWAHQVCCFKYARARHQSCASRLREAA